MTACDKVPDSDGQAILIRDTLQTCFGGENKALKCGKQGLKIISMIVLEAHFLKFIGL